MLLAYSRQQASARFDPHQRPATLFGVFDNFRSSCAIIWPQYARRLGFRAAFLHPQRAAGMCLARLPALKCQPQKLDLWIKGPVFYSQDVNLSAIQTATEIRFGLALAGDPRFAISGTWKHL
jgi:hypothetical protein